MSKAALFLSQSISVKIAQMSKALPHSRVSSAMNLSHNGEYHIFNKIDFDGLEGTLEAPICIPLNPISQGCYAEYS